jgi:hypothetical protein
MVGARGRYNQTRTAAKQGIENKKLLACSVIFHFPLSIFHSSSFPLSQVTGNVRTSYLGVLAGANIPVAPRTSTLRFTTPRRQVKRTMLGPCFRPVFVAQTWYKAQTVGLERLSGRIAKVLTENML